MKRSTTTLVLCIILVLVIAGYLALKMALKEVNPIASFDQCVEAGYSVREGYPEVCVAPDGQSFSNPDQIAPAAPVHR